MFVGRTILSVVAKDGQSCPSYGKSSPAARFEAVPRRMASGAAHGFSRDRGDGRDHVHNRDHGCDHDRGHDGSRDRVNGRDRVHSHDHDHGHDRDLRHPHRLRLRGLPSGTPTERRRRHLAAVARGPWRSRRSLRIRG